MMLGEMGAEVIKIETPHGRDTAADVHHGTPVHYHSFNRGKRNIAIDTKTDAGREAVRKLVATADVYMQNMRPGVAERMGLGYADLISVNPDLIYCSISGFGDYGPCVFSLHLLSLTRRAVECCVSHVVFSVSTLPQTATGWRTTQSCKG